MKTDDYQLTATEDSKVDLEKQARILSCNPFDPSKQLQLEDLVEFLLFDADNKAFINENLYVQRVKKQFWIVEDNVVLTKFRNKVDLVNNRTSEST